MNLNNLSIMKEIDKNRSNNAEIEIYAFIRNKISN